MIIASIKGGRVVLNDATLSLVPEFRELSETDVQFLFLYAWSRSPYSDVEEGRRLGVVAKDVYGDHNSKRAHTPVMKSAIEKLRLLCDDPIINNRMVIRKKMEEINTAVENTKLAHDDIKESLNRSKLINELQKSLRSFEEQLEELNNRIYRKAHGIEIRGKEQLSVVERMYLEERLPTAPYMTNKKI